MKKFGKILLIFMLLFTVFGCEKEETDAIKFAKEYNSVNGEKTASGNVNRTLNIPDDNPFIYQSADDIVERINNKESFVVYFGFATCPWCRSMIEELIRCAKDNNTKTIYYVDVLEIRDKIEFKDGELVTTTKGTDGYMELIHLMSDVLSDYTIIGDDGEVSTGEKRIYAPNVVAVVDGKATKMAEGISPDLTDPYQELTDKMKNDSYNSLKCIFECIKENQTMCQKNAC